MPGAVEAFVIFLVFIVPGVVAARAMFLERAFTDQEDPSLGEEFQDTNGVWIDCEAVRVLRFLKAAEHCDAEIA